MAQNKLEKFKEIMRAVNESLTREEFTDAFKIVLEFVKKTEARNVEDFKAINKAVAQLSKEVKDKADLTLEDIKFEVSNQLQNFSKIYEAKLSSIKDGERGEKGDPGESIIGPPGPEGPAGSPDTGDQIIGKINLSESLIEMERIDGLIEALEELKKLKGKVIMGGSGGSSGGKIVKVHDLSGSLDGVTKTFSLPAFWRIISIHSSSTPNAFRETTDYTADGSLFQVTFTSAIDAASTLASGQTLIVVYAEA